MTLQEAIKLIQKDIENPGSVCLEDLNPAQELGIEALKREIHVRTLHKPNPLDLLPGETKE